MRIRCICLPSRWKPTIEIDGGQWKGSSGGFLRSPSITVMSLFAERLSHPLAQRQLVYVLLGGGLGRTLPEVICGQLLEGILSPPLPQLHEAHVVQDTPQPPAHGLWFAQPLYRAQGHDEDVLDDVLGLLRSVPQDAE